MSSYFARIVLHQTGGTDDYSELHTEMEKCGFVRTVGNTQGEYYDLPAGMYCFDKTDPKNNFRNYHSPEMARTAITKAIEVVLSNDKLSVRKANTPPTVLVISTDSASWSGLDKVKRP